MKAFADDTQALYLAQGALSVDTQYSLSPDHKSFLCMPLMHSESRTIHQVAVELLNEPGMETIWISNAGTRPSSIDSDATRT